MSDDDESRPLLQQSPLKRASDAVDTVGTLRSSKRLAAFACLGITARVTYFIITPLWMDYFTPINPSDLVNCTTINTVIDTQFNPASSAGIDAHFTTATNITLGQRMTKESFTEGTTESPSDRSNRATSVYFVMISQWTMSVVVFGLVLLAIKILSPSHISVDVEHTYPKKEFMKIGVSQGISSVLCNYALSGTRTAPYLIAILSNCNIPIQFFIRWILLHKGSTRTKLFCALAVTVAEFICMIPTIVPSLESESAHDQEGGSNGVGRFLWPLCYVLSQVPFAVANTMTERGVQKTSNHSLTQDGVAKINIFYFLFWWNLFAALTILLLFWTDIIPEFGTSNSMGDFARTMLFDLKCLFGGGEGDWTCPKAVTALGWMNFVTMTLASLAFAGMIRYSDGANFTMIIMSLRTPLVFLFWTLFVENPFGWRPHIHLSTWLSIAAVCIMLPAIYFYNMDDVRENKKKHESSSPSNNTPTTTIIQSTDHTALATEDC